MNTCVPMRTLLDSNWVANEMSTKTTNPPTEFRHVTQHTQVLILILIYFIVTLYLSWFLISPKLISAASIAETYFSFCHSFANVKVGTILKYPGKWLIDRIGKTKRIKWRSTTIESTVAVPSGIAVISHHNCREPPSHPRPVTPNCALE